MVGSCQRIPVFPTPLSCQESPQSESRASFPRIPRHIHSSIMMPKKPAALHSKHFKNYLEQVDKSHTFTFFSSF